MFFLGVVIGCVIVFLVTTFTKRPILNLSLIIGFLLIVLAFAEATVKS